MKAFEYAQPASETEVLEYLSDSPGETEILAGGTDLVGLMKKMVITPERVVNIMEVPSLKKIETLPDGSVKIGAAVRLDELLDAPELCQYPAVQQAISGLGSMQVQCQSTIGGEICQRPRCWYFRSGHGLLAHAGQMAAEGDNRNHAIFGNDGPAKFVSGTRVGLALIAHGAKVRIVGPDEEDEQLLDLASLYRTPRHEGERENVLRPNQFVSHIVLPENHGVVSGTYEVRASQGPDYPLAAAAAALRIVGGRVREARIVLGQVAPIPWVSEIAAHAMEGQPVNDRTAQAAGEAAISQASPLKDNEYKVQLAKVSVKRAILRAAGMDTGGFE